MQFVNPIWLWGLTGLLIPVCIHLLSRKEGKLIRIGSIRHLQDTNTKQFKSIRLNELLLLGLRCLLITLLVLLLSGLYFTDFEKKSKWLLIENGLSQDPEFSFLIDSLRKNGFEIKSLSHGFPDLKDSKGNQEKINYWSLLEELQTESLEHAIVISRDYIDGFKGKRIVMPDHIQWLSKQRDSVEYILNAFRLSEDSVMIRYGRSNPNKTTFYNKKIKLTESILHGKPDSISVENPNAISVIIISDSLFAYDKKIMVAALSALDKKIPYSLMIETVQQKKYSDSKESNWVIWLSDTPPPYINHHLIRFSNNVVNDASLLYQVPNVSGNSMWLLTRRLNEEIALKENLTVQLARILMPGAGYQNRVIKFDKRVLPEQILRTTASASVTIQSGLNTTLSKTYIAVALLLVLLAERWLAFKRHL